MTTRPEWVCREAFCTVNVQSPALCGTLHINGDGLASGEMLKNPLTVALAKAGAQVLWALWIPAFAGMTSFSALPLVTVRHSPATCRPRANAKCKKGVAHQAPCGTDKRLPSPFNIPTAYLLRVVPAAALVASRVAWPAAVAAAVMPFSAISAACLAVFWALS